MATKDPTAELDWAHDWSQWLPEGDTLSTSAWVASTITDDPAPLVIDSDDHDDTTATVWVSGGTAGKRYRLTNTVTTTGGRTDERTLTIDVRDR